MTEGRRLTMTPARYKVGDRVKVRFSKQLPAGTVGTIMRVYTSVQEGYDVQFDDHRQALMWGYELERAHDTSQPDHPDSSSVA
jgi:hypothetical protein